MKKAAASLPVKIIAVILTVLAIMTCVFGIVGIVVLMRSDAYSDGGQRLLRKTAVGLLREDVENVERLTGIAADSYPGQMRREAVQANLDQAFAAEKTNFRYAVYNAAGDLLYGNTELAEEDAVYSFVGSASNEPPSVTIHRTFSNSIDATAFVGSIASKIGEEYSVVESSLDWMDDGTVAVNVVARPSTTYRILAAIPEELSFRDKYFYFEYFINRLILRRRLLILVVLVSAAAACILLAFLMIASGRRSGDDEIHDWIFDRIPLELFIVLILLVGLLPNLWFRLSDWFSVMHITEYQDRFPLSILVIALRSLLSLWLLLSITIRCKKHTLLTNTILYRLVLLYQRIADFTGRRFSSLWKFVLLLLLITAAEGVVLFTASHRWLTVVWIAEKLVIFVVGAQLAMNLDRIEIGGKRLHDGNFDSQINLRGMLPGLKTHADHLNGISTAMRQSVDERMRSERLKTELITNVSHDIKTPLTSVITYVDLLQREGLDSPDAEAYLGVIARQTGKLKKLVVDLVEASKASTGSIPVHREPLDANLLLSQAAGEYADRITAKNLEIIYDLNKALPMIIADPKLLWRVLDNLLNNILQYSQPGTRVYLSTAMEAENVTILFRNISGSQLNISCDELMARFVLGDPSRNTEGSGLGLSIAKALTELQGGELKVEIDCDLFKVRLMFPIAAETDQAPEALSEE